MPLCNSAQLARHGYTYDFIDPVDLAGSAAGRSHDNIFDSGPHYRALIIDGQTSLSVDAARAIRRYAADGLPVVIVGRVPSQAEGLRHAATNDALVSAAMQAVLASPAAVHVGTEDEVPAALAGLGVDPGASFSGAGADIWTVQRHTGRDETWWAYNPTDTPITTTGSFAATGRPYLLDLWNGKTTPVAQYLSSHGRTAMPVTIPAHGTLAVLIAHGANAPHVVATSAQQASYDHRGNIVLEDAGGGTQSYTLSNGRPGTVDLGPAAAPVTVTGWHLDVDEITPSGHTAHHLDLAALADWRDIPELTDAVGSATYTATVTVPGSWAGHDVRLALGAFAGAARVSVNGVRVTHQTTPGGDVAITSLLHPGGNSLVVDLDTTVNDRNAQLAAAGNGAYATGPTPLASTPSGLLGPVTVTPIAMQAIRPRPASHDR